MVALRKILAVVFWLTVAGESCYASTPFPIPMKCPVGGKTFTHIGTGSSSTWGARPDGKTYGSWESPEPVPECPDNGLVIFEKFSKDDIKKLEVIVPSAEFQALRSETTYFRIHYLHQKLHADAGPMPWILLQAKWESDNDASRHKRYTEAFIESAKLKLKTSTQNDLGWWALNGRLVNALRELGRFEEATALISVLPLKNLNVPIPAKKVSGTTSSGLGQVVENWEEIRAAENKRSWIGYFQDMQKLIARKDISLEPLDMIPVREAASICEHKAQMLTDFEKSYCIGPEMQREADLRQEQRGGIREKLKERQVEQAKEKN
jgi:hypothetical protein